MVNKAVLIGNLGRDPELFNCSTRRAARASCGSVYGMAVMTSRTAQSRARET
jgi:single-stranded DNA-binding protein